MADSRAARVAARAGEGLIEFIEGVLLKNPRKENYSQSKYIEYIADFKKKIENLELIEYLDSLEDLLAQRADKKKEIKEVCEKIISEIKVNPLLIKKVQEEAISKVNDQLTRFGNWYAESSIYQTPVPLFTITEHAKKIEVSLKRKIKPSEKIVDKYDLYYPETSSQLKRSKKEKNKQENFCPQQKRR